MIGIDTNVLIRLLVDDPEALVQNQADRALAHYRSGIDFADGVILEVNRARDLTLYTFDRRFARLEGVERLGNQPTEG